MARDDAFPSAPVGQRLLSNRPERVRNQIVQLYPLLPEYMEVDRDSSGTLAYTYTTSSGARVTLRPDEVLHIPGLGF